MLEPNIKAIIADNESRNTELPKLGYLQSSPEFHMKRLISAGYGDIFQITKAFRSEELGKRHNHEFSMLEWYRLNWDYMKLADEVSRLLSVTLETPPAVKRSYQSVFESKLGINPHQADLQDLKEVITDHLDVFNANELNEAACLDLIFSHLIEPNLGASSPVILYAFPSCLSELSQVANMPGSEESHALRFEIFYKGLEIGNGYQEITDIAKLKERFSQQKNRLDSENIKRPLDHLYIAAASDSLPACSGVSLGLDRILMLLMGVDDISEVISFSSNRA